MSSYSYCVGLDKSSESYCCTYSRSPFLIFYSTKSELYSTINMFLLQSYYDTIGDMKSLSIINKKIYALRQTWLKKFLSGYSISYVLMKITHYSYIFNEIQYRISNSSSASLKNAAFSLRNRKSKGVNCNVG